MFDLRPHQEAAISKMHNGCILCGGVGVGKSHTAVGYYLNNEAPKPVYVITTAKKRDKGDWQEIWAQVGMHWNPEWTMGATVVVDSWERIKEYEGVENAFFVFDEQRLVGTGRWVKAFYKIAAANRWIMLSATPGDNWLDYVPVFRANGFIKNITQFKEDHVLSRWTGRYYQVTGYRQVGKLVRWRNSLLVDMPYEKHTVRHTHEVVVEYDKTLVNELVKKRWHVYENRPLTDASELFRVMRRVVYTDDSRLQAIRGLLTKHPKLIVFYNFDYELEIMRTLKIQPEFGSTTAQHSGSPGITQPDQLYSDKTLLFAHTVKKSDQLNSRELVGQETPKSRSMKTPKPSTKLSERTQDESLNEQRSEMSVSTIDPTPSGMESITQSSTSKSITDVKSSMDPWDYLLSPEGMRANKLLQSPEKI